MKTLVTYVQALTVDVLLNNMTPKEYIKEFENIPLCYDDGIIENDCDGDFIRGQSHFKSHARTYIISTIISVLKEQVKNVEDIYRNGKCDTQVLLEFRIALRSKIREWEELLDNK